MTDENPNFSIRIEPLVEGTPIGESPRSRLVVEGRTELMIDLGELIVYASGGIVQTATSYSNGEPTDVTDYFRPEQIDPLSTGDSPGEV